MRRVKYFIGMTSSKMMFVTISLFGMTGGAVWAPEKSEDHCEATIRQTIHEDRSTVVDETTGRLHSSWISQECEVRAGPEYVIRKYTFFDNGTFLLMRHYYAEESCSVAMYTVTARGLIHLMSSSNQAPGATDARYQLNRVHIVPLTRQVAQKFSHRVNVSCTPQPRWRRYVPQLIYEQPSRRFSNFLWQGPTYNALQQPRHRQTSRKHRGLDCLDSLGIEFGELRLVRVQKKFSMTMRSSGSGNGTLRVQLFLGSLPPNVHAKKTHRSTSLQPTALLRIDTTSGCLVCGSISRGTESSPPLLHEVAALPALLGGSWLSSSCESYEGGFWIKRQLTMYAGDLLWTGRWDYYVDPKCTNFVYAITAAGSYIQRAGGQRRHGDVDRERKNSNHSADSRNLPRARRNAEVTESVSPELSRSLLRIYSTTRQINEEHGAEFGDRGKTIVQGKTRGKREATIKTTNYSYRNFFDNGRELSITEAFAAMLRGNQRPENMRKRRPTVPPSPPPPPPPPPVSSIPTGTTELDLHIAESILIAGDLAIAARCGSRIIRDEGDIGLGVKPLVTWPRNCVRHALEAPSTLGLRARLGVNWNGQYTLLLGPRDDNLWEAPLHQCGSTPSHNPALRAHLRASLGLRYGLYASSSADTKKFLYSACCCSSSSSFFIIITLSIVHLVVYRWYR